MSEDKCSSASLILAERTMWFAARSLIPSQDISSPVLVLSDEMDTVVEVLRMQLIRMTSGSHVLHSLYCWWCLPPQGCNTWEHFNVPPTAHLRSRCSRSCSSSEGAKPQTQYPQTLQHLCEHEQSICPSWLRLRMFLLYSCLFQGFGLDMVA